MLITQIKTAIYKFLATDANAFKTALTGGLYYVQHPEKSPSSITYPYAIYQFVAGSYDRDSGSLFAKPVIQIDIYDNQSSADRVSDLGEKLDARLHDSEASVSMTNYNVLSIERVSPPRETLTYMARWHHSRDYLIYLHKK